MVDSINVLEVLGIDTASIAKTLTREAKLKGLPMKDFSEEKVKDAFCAGVEVDIEEIQNVNTGTRATVIKRDSSGKIWGVKNVWLNRKALLDALLDFSEFVLCLSPISLIRAFKDIFEMLQISLSSDEVFVFWTIYKGSKQGSVSDDNLVSLIEKASVNEGYDDLSEKEIKKIVEQLIQVHMLKKEDNSYKITEKLVIQWL